MLKSLRDIIIIIIMNGSYRNVISVQKKNHPLPVVNG